VQTLPMTDWLADAVSCAALMLAGATFLDGRRRAGRQEAVEAKVAQLEEDRRSEELRPEFNLEEGPPTYDDIFFVVRVRSHCDRTLHVGSVSVMQDGGALAGLGISRQAGTWTNGRDLDLQLPPYEAFELELARRYPHQRGTGRITLQVDEPGTRRNWTIELVVTMFGRPSEMSKPPPR